MLPHRYPFLFVDRPEDGNAPLRVRLTQGKRSLLGGPEFPTLLAIEIIAQGAGLEAGSSAPGPPGTETEAPAEAVYLAGCEARFSELLVDRPLTVGDELEVFYEQGGAFGRLRRVTGRMRRRGEEDVLVEVELMLSA